MGSEGGVDREGKIIESLPNEKFRVRLDEGREVTGWLSDSMKMDVGRLLPGDRVKVELASDSHSDGRIVYRYK